MDVQDQPFFPVERIGFNGLPASQGNRLARISSLYDVWKSERVDAEPEASTEQHE
jgi:hypothetical protein